MFLLLAQNLPTELQVCPHPQTHRVGVFWGQNPGGLAVSQVKILLIFVTRAQRACRALQAQPQTGNMDQGPQAPPSQPATAMAPPVLPAPPPPLLVVPAVPSTPVFTLGPGCSHDVLDYDDPNMGLQPPNCTSRPFPPSKRSLTGKPMTWPCSWSACMTELAVSNRHHLITVPIDDGTTRNIMSLENTRTQEAIYVNSPMQDAQYNDLFYYFLADSITNEFCTMGLLYTDV